MDYIKKNSAIVALIVVLAIFGFTLPSLLGNAVGLSITQTVNQLTDSVKTSFGSVVGDTTFFECESHNGVKTCFTGKPLTQATTTPCSIKSPSATSTLVSGGMILNFSSSTAQKLWASKATNYNATTTSLATSTISASGQGFVDALATTSFSVDPILAQADRVFSPNTYFNVGLSGGTPSANTGALYAGMVPENKPVGYCYAEFKVLGR